MKYLFYCCKYLYCEINESEMSIKKKKNKKKVVLKGPVSLLRRLCLGDLTPSVKIKWGQMPVAEVAEIELAGLAEFELEPVSELLSLTN